MRKVILQPSERILMEELWEENPQTITQLFHTLNEKRDWTKSTVSTMLNRMSKKGLLRFEQGKKQSCIILLLNGRQLILLKRSVF